MTYEAPFLTGQGREEIGCTNLNLSHCSITGLPQFQWNGLRYLSLDSNMIHGPFPLSICSMRYLHFLDMSNNRFGGLIPQCLGNVGSYLAMVDLGNNRFYGTIPNVYEDCERLKWLILNGNKLQGQMPNSLSNCQSLTVLDMGNNHLNDTFPGWLGHLPHLQVLILKSNYFHGPIETASKIDSPFSSLLVLDLSQNGFVGLLPVRYFQSLNAMKDTVRKGTKPEYMNFGGKYYSLIVAVKGHQLFFTKFLVDYTVLDLSDNRFKSEIPDIIGSLNSLIVLNSSKNSIVGQIPRALGKLSEIESLDLSCNQLTGEIPESLADLTFLGFLNLSQNHLVGSIPQGKQFNTFEGSSFGGNAKLCGLPLAKDCSEDPQEPQAEADGNDESGFTWKVVMGYGCGTLLGLVMGYLMLSTGRPKWFNAIADAMELLIRTRQNKKRYTYIGK